MKRLIVTLTAAFALFVGLAAAPVASSEDVVCGSPTGITSVLLTQDASACGGGGGVQGSWWSYGHEYWGYGHYDCLFADGYGNAWIVHGSPWGCW